MNAGVDKARIPEVPVSNNKIVLISIHDSFWPCLQTSGWSLKTAEYSNSNDNPR
ncbi:hypothetical protein Mpsy_0129 [Methanolobus psychrophilus R15]|nr:hypothetical protein Mpsy_0129 [Methanolobus psychrophilus R15]